MASVHRCRADPGCRPKDPHARDRSPVGYDVTARLGAAAALDRAIRERIGDAGLDQLYKVLEAVGEVSREKAEFEPANFYRAPNL